MVPRAADDTVGLVGLLAQRGDYLESIADGVTEKRALVDAHDASRSTVDRAVRQLADAGLVDRTHGEVALTTTGRLALDAYTTFRNRVTGIDDANDVLDGVDDADDLDVRLFENATVVEAAHTPQKPMDEVADVIRTATEVRVLAPLVLPSHVEIYRDRVNENALAADVVVTQAVLDELVTNHQDTIETFVGSDDAALSFTNDDLPYGLVLASLDDRDVVLVVCGTGPVAGVLRNDTPDAVAWAADRFASARETATRLG
ncbi:winged helix-turn-helix domain-containing protein [Salarchaeum sp. JOR-1]|uniref:helix-turn-helix transcriptional regulator n=1 Tax=Salarchaeum sp. JOR-1 TaxID=2599399 RepID=UPI0011986A0F|nr:hypothetical protein [Salarchaeum sp. JOR-1]QDX39556.1 hypothetical protein FQU85_01125 [Salarchaeum sp. JOR-1]